jgi:hypothetical protein
MKKLVKKFILISLLPILFIFTGCGTLTANSAVSARHIKAPDKGSLVYMRHSTKVDPNTLSEVSDLQDLRRAIKGDVEEAAGGGGLFGIKTIANLFKPTTKANRTFSEVFIANADGVLSDEVITSVADQLFKIKASASETIEKIDTSLNVDFSTNRFDAAENAMELLKEKIKELSDQISSSGGGAPDTNTEVPNNNTTEPNNDVPEVVGIPGGNPNGAKLGGGNDQAPSSSFLWKPQRDGTAGEAALLLPYTIRAKTITVNGKKPKLNSISNGYRETYYLKRPAGAAEIIVKGYDGKTYKKTIPDASKRVDGGGMTVASATGPAAPNNTLVVVPTLAKHDIFIAGGVAHMSDYLATLERKIDSRWMNGKMANKLNPSGAEWSNVLLETSDGKRHAFQRTSTKTKYLVPSTTKSGDWKIRQKGIHSYLKNKPLQDGVISLAGSQWLSDNAPWPKVSPPVGW